MKGNIGQLMKQAQQMQENMRRMQESLAATEVEGQSGAGMVKVQMTCKHEAQRVLPGVGPRSAQRMAYHLLQHDRAGAGALAEALTAALQAVRRCEKCN